jgi:PilZ domain
MQEHCSVPECTEEGIASIDDRVLCRTHFLTWSYQRLEAISGQINRQEFHERQADAAGRFLEGCMHDAADIACAVAAPSNLERARVLDVLLWASELHARLRRGPRVPARIPVLLRSEAPEHPWEEQAETQLLSRHGAQLRCRHELSVDERLTCVRLDNGREAEARVAWMARKGAEELEVGIEFLKERNFWGLSEGGSVSNVNRDRDSKNSRNSSLAADSGEL